jgi:hypothetical protein
MEENVAHFWAGTFENKDLFDAFYAEKYRASTTQPVSKFAASQNLTWLDHDFVEAGYQPEDVTAREKFRNYSWANLWMDEFEKRIAAQGITEVNTLIMVFLDKEDDPIRTPKAIQQPGINMAYLGKIKFLI